MRERKGAMHMSEQIAVVLVRGLVHLNHGQKDTLRMLRLHRKNSCAVVPKTESYLGMVHKVKDFVTWGEVNQEVSGLLSQRMGGNIAHLQPPRKGFGRKGIKVPFRVGGALGYRGEKINDLLRRMM